MVSCCGDLMILVGLRLVLVITQEGSLLCGEIVGFNSSTPLEATIFLLLKGCGRAVEGFRL